MTNLEALNLLHNLIEQISLNGKDRDQARACAQKLGQFITQTENPPKVETKNADHG